MKADINIHVDNFAEGIPSVSLVVEIFNDEEFPAKYEEIHTFYISKNDSPEEIYKALKVAITEVHYWEE